MCVCVCVCDVSLSPLPPYSRFVMLKMPSGRATSLLLYK